MSDFAEFQMWADALKMSDFAEFQMWADALEIALNIADEEDTDVTEDDVNGMSKADLMEWLSAWGLEYKDNAWIRVS